MNKETRAVLLEAIASVQHAAWWKWAEAVAPEVAPERAARWKNYFVPYDQLDEKTKKLDREWAEEVLLVIEPYLTQGAEKAVVYKVDAARYPGLSKILAADPSLQPPKKWFGEMQRDIKKSNPSYSDEQVRKTIGDIWYHNLSDAKRTEIREREGKHYGAA
jgi:hypothetical protein